MEVRKKENTQKECKDFGGRGEKSGKPHGVGFCDIGRGTLKPDPLGLDCLALTYTLCIDCVIFGNCSGFCWPQFSLLY